MLPQNASMGGLILFGIQNIGREIRVRVLANPLFDNSAISESLRFESLGHFWALYIKFDVEVFAMVSKPLQ